MGTTTIKYFAYAHLPPRLQAVSKPLGDVAQMLETLLPDGPEKSAGMRKLLEAKDCFVRAAVDLPDVDAVHKPALFGTPDELIVIFRCEGFRSKEDPLGLGTHDIAVPLAHFNARDHLVSGVLNQKLSVMTRAELDEKYPHMSWACIPGGVAAASMKKETP